MAGYSTTPLLHKIGVQPGHRVYLDDLPDGRYLDWPDDVSVMRRLSGPPVNIAWTFCVERARLERRISRLVEHTVVDGMVWLSWPKKSSGLAGDLDENVVRRPGWPPAWSTSRSRRWTRSGPG